MRRIIQFVVVWLGVASLLRVVGYGRANASNFIVEAQNFACYAHLRQ
jgi:hypothetical protein